jgi:lysophospholipase L1-like esterase
VRSGAVVLGLLAGLLVAEAALQLGALYVRATGRPQAAVWRTDRLRVLCLGDSNTYGILELREDAYPAVLERLWNAATPAQPVEVLNMGFPGLNSSKIRKNFRGLMTALRPDLVLILVGSNDLNSVPVPIEGADGVRARLQYATWRHSRVFRLLYMLAAGTRDEKIEVESRFYGNPRHGRVNIGEAEFDLAGTARMDPTLLREWSVHLRANLRAMAADAAAVGATFILLTYPSHQSLYAHANNVITTMTDLPVVDLAPRFQSLCSTEDCPELFRRSQHPNANGYRVMAAILFNYLRQAGLASSPPGDPAAFASLDANTRRYLKELGYLP